MSDDFNQFRHALSQGDEQYPVRHQRRPSKYGLWPAAVIMLAGILATGAGVGLVGWMIVRALKALIA